MDDAGRSFRRRGPAARSDDVDPAYRGRALSRGDWSLRRFRANLVIETDGDGWVEDAWCGTSTLTIGAARLLPEQLCVRCTMVTRPQPDLAEDRDLFRTLARHHGGLLGAWTAVAAGGSVGVGEPVTLAETSTHVLK